MSSHGHCHTKDDFILGTLWFHFYKHSGKKSNTFLLENTFESQTAFSQLDSWIYLVQLNRSQFFFPMLIFTWLKSSLSGTFFSMWFLETFDSLIRLILSNFYQLSILPLWFFFWCVAVISSESNFAHSSLLKDSSLSILLITNFSPIKNFFWVKLWTQNSFVMNTDHGSLELICLRQNQKSHSIYRSSYEEVECVFLLPETDLGLSLALTNRMQQKWCWASSKLSP